jgi:hypothetical protein
VQKGKLKKKIFCDAVSPRSVQLFLSQNTNETGLEKENKIGERKKIQIYT